MFYRTFSFQELKVITERYTNIIVKKNENGVMLFTQQGARLLGMFPDSEGDNVLWVNRDVENFIPKHYALVGGERLWISPERNFYYENPRDFAGYRIPHEIDPGEYECLEGDDSIVFANSFSLLEYDQNKLFDNSLEKRSFSLVPDPYNTDLPYIGVSITDEISVNDSSIEMCAWSLAQVYTGGPESPGTALFPITGNCEPISYFDPIPPDRVDVCNGYVRFKIDGSFSNKLGIRPEDCNLDIPCKALYLSKTPSDNATWFCVIKRSNDVPHSQEECVDTAMSDPAGPKGAVQAFNTDHGSKEELSAFPCGELGLQLSRGIVEDNRTVSKGTHELLGYTGSKDEMLELAQSVLRIEETPKLY